MLMLSGDDLPELFIDKTKTALVVIDLQKGITSQPTKPYSAENIIKNAVKLVNTFRKNRISVFLIHVILTKATILNPESDESFSHPAPLSPDWSEFVPEIAPTSKDIVITKKQWEHFMEPISNYSYGDVGLIRSCSVELQQISALRAQQGLPMSTDFVRFLPRMLWPQDLRNSTMQQ
jgi:hypothetical protein